jgi:hypothetical protein
VGEKLDKSVACVTTAHKNKCNCCNENETLYSFSGIMFSVLKFTVSLNIIHNSTKITTRIYSGVPRNFVRRGVQQIQLRAEGRENGDLGAVAP